MSTNPPAEPDEDQATIVGSFGRTANEGTPATRRAAEQGATVGPSGPGAAATCPDCGQPLEPGGRFCEACGAQVGVRSGEPAEAEAGEKARPWFALVVVIWLLIMVAAFAFIYGSAFVVGST